MKIRYSKETENDFKKHRDYLKRKGKSDGHKYQNYELNGISKSLKNNISKGIENTKEHKKSIYPKEFKYNFEDYNMYVDKKSHHIVFYKIERNKKGEEFIQIEKCIHSTELRKILKEKGIRPLKGADSSLLNDIEEVYKEDEVNLRDDSEDSEEGKEEGVYDEETGKKIKRIVFTGPKGGRYYKTDNGEKVYIDENRVKGLGMILLESKMISLTQYIKEKCCTTSQSKK